PKEKTRIQRIVAVLSRILFITPIMLPLPVRLLVGLRRDGRAGEGPARIREAGAKAPAPGWAQARGRGIYRRARAEPGDFSGMIGAHGVARTHRGCHPERSADLRPSSR